MHHEPTKTSAKGKWRGILMSFGLPEKALTGKHGPCPMCGGTDRFRWDNREGSGSYICGTCGAGDGMKLAMAYTGKEFREIAALIDGMMGNIKPEAPRPAMTDDRRRDLLRDVYRATTPAAPGDVVHAYLQARGVGELIYPDALRFAPRLADGDGGLRPCMVAMVSGLDGKPVSMHRTFLAPDGKGKAEMAAPRKLMPGELPDGACVRLCEYVSGGPLGIAEGIETALSASALWGLPVWAALNTALLKRWLPPEGCTEVAIFGDTDASFAGQAAAYGLAHRLRGRGLHVTVHLPETFGEDWNDIHIRRTTDERSRATI